MSESWSEKRGITREIFPFVLGSNLPPALLSNSRYYHFLTRLSEVDSLNSQVKSKATCNLKPIFCYSTLKIGEIWAKLTSRRWCRGLGLNLGLNPCFLHKSRILIGDTFQSAGGRFKTQFKFSEFFILLVFRVRRLWLCRFRCTRALPRGHASLLERFESSFGLISSQDSWTW